MIYKIIIDPNHKIVYSSFYIKGLMDVFGERNIAYSSKYFFELKGKTESNSFDHYFAFVLIDFKRNTLKKIVVDYRDKQSIKKNAYKWCDVYAKINYSLSSTPEAFRSKIISIPPSFGIQIYGLSKTIFYGIVNLCKSFSRLNTSIRLFLANYKGQFLRPDLAQYKPQNSDNYYLFFISSIWQHENCITNTNVERSSFIRECKNNQSIKFEGGLFALPSNPQYNLYSDIVFSKRYSYLEYIKNTHKSIFVFNTPSVHECHGWKLGEFLAMGKAIISYPILNDLPEPLVHGQNIHIVSNESELKSAIRTLVEDKVYRTKLENGAKAYYEKYCSPTSVIKRILNLIE